LVARLAVAKKSDKSEVFFMAEKKRFYPFSLAGRLPLAARRKYWAIRDARRLASACALGLGEYWGEAAEIPY
jgi:hypothetical protein